MKRTVRLTSMVFLTAVATFLLSTSVFAQLAETPAPKQAVAPVANQAPTLTAAAVEATLAAIEADTGIEDTVRDLLRPKYQQVIEALKEAESNTAQAAEYRNSMKQAPDMTAETRAELEKLPTAEVASNVRVPDSPEETQLKLEAEQARLAALREQLSRVTSELGGNEQRPAVISVRIPEAERELAEVRKQLASPDLAEDTTSPGRVAERLLLRAREARLLSELELLHQEQLSLSVRGNLQQAQYELLTRQVENVSATIAAYRTVIQEFDTREARELTTRAAELLAEVPQDDEKALRLATEVQTLAKQLESVLQDKPKISAAKVDVTAKLNRMTQRYDSISRQLALGQPSLEMARVLIDLRNLINTRRREVAQVRRWPTLDQTRLASVKVDFEIENQKDVPERFADPPPRVVQELIKNREKVLARLQKQYLDVIPELSSFESEMTRYFNKSQEIRADISQQLFWIQISPEFSISTLGDTPDGVRWVFGSEHWTELGTAMRDAWTKSPKSSFFIVALAVALLLMRPRIGAALKRAGEGVGRVSTDRYGLTAKTFLWTVLLALPVPLLLRFVTSALAQADTPSNWLRGLNIGMSAAVLIIFAACVISACCYPGGLAAVHFRWHKESLCWCRRLSRWFAVVYVPLELVTSSTLFAKTALYLDSVGRVSFMLGQASLAVVVARLVYSSDGIRATFFPEESGRSVAHWRSLIAALMIAFPCVLFVLAGLGYVITGLNLSLQLVLTLIIVTSGAILYGVILRWFKIEHRKLALSEALEKRRARQEASAAEGQPEETDEIIAVDEEEQGLDLDSVDEQTRYLLQLMCGLGVATAVLYSWSATIPLIPYLEGIRLTNEFTLLELAKAGLAVAVTWIATKNLPGLLELAILRATKLDAGTRHAITTICQYGMIATGFTALFNVLNLDWTKFGWIAGGLSVGIGFGMQEVVANFVCGLILLFERPIRVGDVVMVEGETGTVTKLNIRSTTITNFDRGEVVLPNKTLITTKLLNWTLSASVNRVAVPVGVAYGTDTELARKIMLEIAADNPNVLDDPPPMALFQEFGDSSLNLVLRAFLPDRSYRESTITELFTEIDKRFAAAGIEISFPQRDLNLRTGWDRVGKESDADGTETVPWAK